jgi:hypothetical protein
MMKRTPKEMLNSLTKHYNISLSELAKRAGYDRPQSFYDVVNGKTKKISAQMAKGIVSVFPQVSLSWILTGEGEMLKHAPPENEKKGGVIIESLSDYERAIQTGLKMIPETTFTFAAGETILVKEDRILRYWYLPDSKDCEGIIPMGGESMMPKYPPGCRLSLKKYGFDPKYPLSIPFGQDFAIVVEDPVTGDYHGHIKILRKHPDPTLCRKFWIAKSINKEFDDFEIEICQVKSLWIIKEYIGKNVVL